MKMIDLTGMKFGRWAVLRRSVNTPYGHPRWECVCDCGTERVLLSSTLRSGKSRSCGCYKDERNTNAVKGPAHPNWNTGKHINQRGYVVLHPGLTGTGKSRYEHHVVMEQHLGRAMFPGETVHHKNGIRSDNRIDNLELHVGNHGVGQKPEDVVRWALEMLQRYAPEKIR